MAIYSAATNSLVKVWSSISWKVLGELSWPNSDGLGEFPAEELASEVAPDGVGAHIPLATAKATASVSSCRSRPNLFFYISQIRRTQELYTWYLGWWRKGESGPTVSGRSSSRINGRRRRVPSVNGLLAVRLGLLRARTTILNYNSSRNKFTSRNILSNAFIFRFRWRC